MADAINAKIKLDGESEFKSSVKACVTELRNMESGVKAAEAEMKAQGKTIETLSKQHDALAKAVQSAKKYQDELEKATENAKRNYDRAKESADSYKKVLEEAKKNGTATGEALAKMERDVASSEKSVRSAENAVNQWETKLNKARVTTTELNSKLKENESELNSLKDPYAKAGDAAEDFAKSSEKSVDAVESLAQAMAASGLNAKIGEIKDAMLECIEASKAFEMGLAKVATLADSDIGSLGDGLTELSNSLGVSSTDLAESMYQALSASVDAKDALTFVRDATKLAIGGFTDTTTAVDTLTTIINAYGMKAADAAKISDVLVATQNKGKTTVEALGQSLGQVIPVAATFGVDLENIAASYVIMTKSGINTANATTYIRSMMQELGDSSSKVSKILQEQTGKNFEQLSKQGMSLGDVLEILNRSVDGNSTAFNNLWGNQRAALGGMSIMNAGMEEFSQAIVDVSSSTGIASQNFDKIADTSERAGQRLTVSVENLKIAIGSQLQGALDSVKGKVADVVKKLTEWVEKNPGIVKALGALVTSLVVLGGTLTAYTTITKLATAVTAAFKDALVNTTVGKIVTAITVVVSAIGGLVMLFSNLENESDKLADSSRDLMEAHAESAKAYEESAKKYETSLKAAQDQAERASTAEQAYATAVERQKQVLVENAEATDNLEESQSRLKDTEQTLTEQIEAVIAAGGDASALIQYRTREMAKLNEAIDNSSKVLTENERQLKKVETDVMYYSMAMEELDEASRKALDSAMAEADTLDKNSETYQSVIGQLYAMTAAHDEYSATIQADIDGINEEMATLQQSYDDAYTKAYDSLTGQFGLFEQVSIGAAQSVTDMITALDSQAQYMAEYSANLATVMSMGLSDGLVQALSDGSAESAAILKSIVEDGGQNIDELNQKFAEVQKGKEEFSGQMAEITTDFDSKMGEIEGRLNDAVGKMNMNNKAYQNAVNTIQGFINGAESMRSLIVAKFTSLARSANEAYKREQDQHSPSRKFFKIAQDTVQGIILGTESKKKDVARTYKGLAQTVTNSYEVEVPKIPAIQTTANVEPVVQVFLGDKELTTTMYNGVVKKISQNNRSSAASVGRRA